MRALHTVVYLAFLTSSALAQQAQESQSVSVGPWKIATTYKADKFDNCTMSRTFADVEISFVRTKNGLSLLLDSQKWTLERGKVYSVRLAAGSQSVQAKALAETKGVTITLADQPFNEKLRVANLLEVRGEGATIRVPLDKSAAALERLDLCFEKNGLAGPETNPFVAPTHKPYAARIDHRPHQRLARRGLSARASNESYLQIEATELTSTRKPPPALIDA